MAGLPHTRTRTHIPTALLCPAIPFTRGLKANGIQTLQKKSHAICVCVFVCSFPHPSPTSFLVATNSFVCSFVSHMEASDVGAMRLYVCSHLHELPLPGLEDGVGFLLVPVDVMDLVVVFKVLVQLLGTHQQEHSLESLRTAKHTQVLGLGHILVVRLALQTLFMVC